MPLITASIIKLTLISIWIGNHYGNWNSPFYVRKYLTLKMIKSVFCSADTLPLKSLNILLQALLCTLKCNSLIIRSCSEKSVARIWICTDPHQMERLDPDPYQTDKLNLDPDLHHSDKLDVDPHQFADDKPNWALFQGFEQFFWSWDPDSDPHQSDMQDPDQHPSDADPQHCPKRSNISYPEINPF